jgi:hypothetical protein
VRDPIGSELGGCDATIEHPEEPLRGSPTRQGEAGRADLDEDALHLQFFKGMFAVDGLELLPRRRADSSDIALAAEPVQ